MTNQWSFRYTVATAPEGKPVTACVAENILLRQLKHHERDEEQVLWDLAQLYSRTGQQDVAFEYVKRLVDLTDSPERKAACYLAMGPLMEQIHDYESAIKYYSSALALEPKDRRTWYFINNNLGYCLNHFGRYADAERYCQAAVQIDPTQYNAYKNLGISLEGQGLFAEAGRCYIAAVRANAADSRALRHLEALLDKHPDIADGIAEFQQHLAASRMAVEHVAQMQDEAIRNFRAKCAAPEVKWGWVKKGMRFFGNAKTRMVGSDTTARATATTL